MDLDFAGQGVLVGGRWRAALSGGELPLFLCSDEAALVTGIALDVDGGRCR